MAVRLALLLCVIPAACSRSPAPSEQPEGKPRTLVALRLFHLTNVDVRHVPLLAALDELSSQGHTVERTPMVSAPLMADALARGDTDIAIINNLTMWMAVANGAAARTIAQFTSSTIVVAAKADIRTCKQLDGRPMGVASSRAFVPLLLDVYFKKNCPGTNPHLIVIPQVAGRTAALLAGEVDAVLVPEEDFFEIQMVAPDRFHKLMSYAREFPGMHIDGLHVRLEWAQQNPQVVKDFLKALLRSQRRLTADPDLLVQESVRRLSLDPPSARQIARVHLRNRIWDANGGLTERDVQDTIGFLTEHGALPAGLRAASVADLSYLHSVLDEIGRQ